MKYILGLICLFSLATANAQTLFTYGNEKVTSAEFLRAYKKAQSSSDPVNMKEYLDLYIASKLKVKEARQRRYDTLPQIITELAQLRSQITPAYLNDEEGMNRLIDEAFQRTQKDIRLAHIFIANTADPSYAESNAKLAYNELKKGQQFGSVARRFSNDPAVEWNGGDLGFITVFSLPYELENLAYGTTKGNFSEVYRSKGGYHIFKNVDERKAAGRMKAAQILLAFPPGASEAEKSAIQTRADSIYRALMNGADFSKLAQDFSNDVVSAASGGMIPEFGVGEFDPQFEIKVFGLNTDGAIAAPFMTAHGWHIVKRISVTPVPATMDADTRQSLRDKIEGNDRAVSLKRSLQDKVNKLVAHKINTFRQEDLWKFSDSSFIGQNPQGTKALNANTVLFTTGKDKTTVNMWTSYAQVNRFKRDGSGMKPYAELWKEFLDHRAMDYYTAHLEDYNPAFKMQLDEFREGNLFFEIMQREVWEKAQSDSVALRNYFTKNKSKYVWTRSADAVTFFANDAETANEARQALQNSGNWRQVAVQFNNRVITDSARVEFDQIPNGHSATANSITPVLVNADNTASFAYVIRVYNKPEPKKFEDAKGAVINDFQQDLDKAWTARLKKKYPVVINQKVWADVLKKG